MFKFLFIIFGFFILLMLLLGFSVFRTFKRLLFGSGDTKTQQRTSASGNKQQQSKQQATTTSNAASKKKIIAKDEGEYVDYEEIKD